MSLDIKSIKSNISSNQKVKRTAQIAGIGAVVCGGLTAAGSAVSQKALLTHPDKRIKRLEVQKENLKKACDNSKEMLEKQIKKCDEVIISTKEFVQGGKMNFGTIAKDTLKNAGKAALALGGLYFAAKTVKDFVTKDHSAKDEPKEVPTNSIVPEKATLDDEIEDTTVVKPAVSDVASKDAISAPKETALQPEASNDVVGQDVTEDEKTADKTKATVKAQGEDDEEPSEAIAEDETKAIQDEAQAAVSAKTDDEEGTQEDEPADEKKTGNDSESKE